MLRLAAAVLVVASRGCLAQPEPGQCAVSRGRDGGRHLTCLHAHNVSAVAASLDSLDTPAAASAVTSVSLVGCPDLGAAEDEEWPRTLARLRHVTHLSLQSCQNGTEIFADFQNFDQLETLSIRGDSSLENFKFNCDHLKTLENLDLSENSLEKFTFNHDCDEMSSLKTLNLSSNAFSDFDWNNLIIFPQLEVLDLSDSRLLSSMTTAQSPLPSLHTLDLSRSPQLRGLCTSLLTSLPQLSQLQLDPLEAASLPAAVHKFLPELQPPPCSCDLVTAEAVTSCQLGGATLQLEDALPQLDCARAEISAWTNESTVFVGTRVTLDCDWSAWPRPTIAWLTPRHELLVHRAEPAGDQQQCPGLTTSVLEAEDSWPGHLSVLGNGSLVIEEFGWRDRGEYSCYVDNTLGNDTQSVQLELEPRYRHVIYMWSLLYGLVTAVSFLGKNNVDQC